MEIFLIPEIITKNNIFHGNQILKNEFNREKNYFNQIIELTNLFKEKKGTAVLERKNENIKNNSLNKLNEISLGQYPLRKLVNEKINISNIKKMLPKNILKDIKNENYLSVTNNQNHLPVINNENFFNKMNFELVKDRAAEKLFIKRNYNQIKESIFIKKDSIHRIALSKVDKNIFYEKLNRIEINKTINESRLIEGNNLLNKSKVLGEKSLLESSKISIENREKIEPSNYNELAQNKRNMQVETNKIENNVKNNIPITINATVREEADVNKLVSQIVSSLEGYLGGQR